MKNKKYTTHIRRHFLRRAAKLHMKIATFMLVLYLVLGALIDPRFLLYDFRQKYSTLAASSNVSVSLRIIGAPQAPILTGTPEFQNNILYNQLDWNDPIDATSYDVYRDGILLISGLTNSDYRDTNVQSNIYYTYKVLARGPSGQAYSNEITIHTKQIPLPNNLNCLITTVGGNTFYYNPPLQHTDDHTPPITGTTNIPNALIQVTIESPNGKLVVVGTTYANANGYWSWDCPTSLDDGKNKITATAIDPNNSLRSFTTSGYFLVNKKPDKTSTKSSNSSTTTPESTTQPTTTENIAPSDIAPEVSESAPAPSLMLRTSVGNKDRIVLENEQLALSTKLLTSRTFAANEKIDLQYIFTDEKGNIVYQFSEKVTVPSDKIIKKNVEISNLIPEGNYKVLVKMTDNGVLISAEDTFTVKGLYLFSIGSTRIKMSQVMQSLSWIIIFLFLLAFFFSFLLGLEIFLVGDRSEISEFDLQKRGYFVHVRSGKEVRK